MFFQTLRFFVRLKGPFLRPGLQVPNASCRAAVKTWPQATAQRRVAVLRAALHDATLDQLGSPFVLPGHGSFRGLPTAAAATWHRKAGTPMSRARSLGKAAAGKTGLPCLVPAGRVPALIGRNSKLGEVVGGSDHRGHLATREVAIILPDAMHDHGEFACHRHFRPAHADPRREHQPPAAQCAGAHMPGEQGIGRLE